MTGPAGAPRILALVTANPDQVLPGGAPVLIVRDRAEQERIALLLGRILAGATHDLGNGCFLVVRHG